MTIKRTCFYVYVLHYLTSYKVHGKMGLLISNLNLCFQILIENPTEPGKMKDCLFLKGRQVGLGETPKEARERQRRRENNCWPAVFTVVPYLPDTDLHLKDSKLSNVSRGMLLYHENDFTSSS